jgi:hypothetical protein
MYILLYLKVKNAYNYNCYFVPRNRIHSLDLSLYSVPHCTCGRPDSSVRRGRLPIVVAFCTKLYQ